MSTVLVDGRALGLAGAKVCGYIFPGQVNPVSAGMLSPRDLQSLGADIAANATRHEVDSATTRNCRMSNGPSGAVLISGVNAWGDHIELRGDCSVYTFFDREGARFWTPSESTKAMLTSVLHHAPHPAAGLAGRLLATGGVYIGLQPLAGSVTLRGVRSTVELQAGDDGRFSGEVAPGRYRVVGHSPAYNDNLECATRCTVSSR